VLVCASAITKLGAQAWDVAGLSVTFLDRFGNVVSDGWEGGIRFDKGIAQWQAVGRRYLVPNGAQFARVEIFHKAKKGTFDIADLRLFDPSKPPTGVDVALLGAATNVAKPLDAKAKSGGYPILDPRRGIGAKIDEKAVKVTLLVSANAKAGGDGSKARPFNSLPAAVDAARPLLNEGQGVRIAVQAGLYRMTQEKTVLPEFGHSAAIDLTNWTPQGREAPLIIEGVGGQAVLSGAEASSPNEWKLVNAEKRIYSRPWKRTSAFCTPATTSGSKPICTGASWSRSTASVSRRFCSKTTPGKTQNCASMTTSATSSARSATPARSLTPTSAGRASMFWSQASSASPSATTTRAATPFICACPKA
jgi:hypothetical protein